MSISKLDAIIQESINNGVSLKLLANISSELSTLAKRLIKIVSSGNSPKDILTFMNNLHGFTENVINAIKRCVSANSLDEANEMVRVDQMNIDPIGFINRLGSNLYRDLANGGILGNMKMNKSSNSTNAIGSSNLKLKVLMTNIYPKIRKKYEAIDSTYSSIFSQPKSSEMFVPMKIIGKMDEIVTTIKNAQGNNP